MKKENKKQNKSQKNKNVVIFNYIKSNQNMTNSLSSIKPVNININRSKKNSSILIFGKEPYKNDKLMKY